MNETVTQQDSQRPLNLTPEVLAAKKLVVVVQCHLVTQRCPGFFCERAFTRREHGFANYPKQDLRLITLDCGGCCGRALHRKLALLCKKAKSKDDISSQQILIQFSSCITKDNYHGPACPHLGYLKTLVEKLHLDLAFDTSLSSKACLRREQGIYQKT